MRIERSAEPYLNEKDLSLLHKTELVLVTGQPLHVFPPLIHLPELHFDACPKMVEEPVFVQRLYLQSIPFVGHRHLDSKYLSDEQYPVLQCISFDETEIIMGMRPSLDFELLPPPDIGCFE